MFKKSYHILEIGPWNIPMHHRRAKAGLTVLRDEPMHALPLLRKGELYTALDCSKDRLEVSPWDRISDEMRGRIELVVGWREELPFEDNHFNEIVALASYGHPDSCLEGYNRVLKQSGRLIVGSGSSKDIDMWRRACLEYEYRELVAEGLSYCFNDESFPDRGSFQVVTFQKPGRSLWRRVFG